MGFTVAQVAWRRADQLGNFVRVLELRAINLDDRASVPKKDLCGRFHDARLSGPGWTQEQQVPHRSAGRIQSGAKNLKHVHEGLYTLFLPHNLGAQGRVKIARVRAANGWIQLMADGSFHFINPSRV